MSDQMQKISFDDVIRVENIKLPLITIYKNPKDQPGKYVARLWDIDKPTRYIFIGDTLANVRESIPKHMARLDRQLGDDPNIVENWI